MKTITFQMLIDELRKYNPEEVDSVMKAYQFAEERHRNQKRKSLEPYINHPIAVAYSLSLRKCDGATICAALLHDTVEDTGVSIEEIAQRFGQTVANLVDGVTNLKKINFATKDEYDLANIRKIMEGIMKDPRIILIKLADRLHNMQTLEYTTEEEQQRKARQTMEIFVPLAHHIGAHWLKNRLADLCFKYLEPAQYDFYKQKQLDLRESTKLCLDTMRKTISKELNYQKIYNELVVRYKTIYSLYEKIHYDKKSPGDIHDLIALKVIVNNVEDCYKALGAIHSVYPHVYGDIRDYIGMPKPNMYQSFHTTLFGPYENLVQAQIRTQDMHRVAEYGLVSYWEINKGSAPDVMKEDLKNKFQFYKSLNDIMAMSYNNQTFVEQVKKEIFTRSIYVYAMDGKIIELPEGSTPVDFAYKLGDDIGNNMCNVLVNDIPVQFYQPLTNQARVKIITNPNAVPKAEWSNYVITAKAKRMIAKHTS